MSEKDRKIVFSYGGGIQTVAISILIGKGKLPTPDYIVMADTGREGQRTFEYINQFINPFFMSTIGREVQIASHELATVDLFAHNDDLLLPVYTETGKLPTFCSTEWKENVIKRWLRQQGVESCTAWLGFSFDESDRIRRRMNRKTQLKWYQADFPLSNLMLSRADCKQIIIDHGWPLPPKSACWMCPNRDNADWRDLKENSPDEFQKAVELEKEIQEWDDTIWLHEDRTPLDQVDFYTPDKMKSRSSGQCGLGYCFI